MKYHYEVNSGGRLEFSAEHSAPKVLAEQCAEDYHNNGNWESASEIDLVIYEFSETEDGKELWRGTVYREAVPHFSAREAT